VRVCCLVSQCVACVAVCCSVLQCIAVCCARTLFPRSYSHATVRSSALQYNAMCCSFVSVCCSLLQCVAVCCSVLQCVMCTQIFRRLTTLEVGARSDSVRAQNTFNTLQHTTPHCNTLQHTATHCNTLQHNATHFDTLRHTAT